MRLILLAPSRTFQSTPSARRATNPSAQKARRSMYFNPRPPRGERPTDYSKAVKEAMISIHALREEGDRGLCSMQSPRRYFNPRPPRGERPAASSASAAKTSISIHALREEGDFCVVDHLHCVLQISIHALREEGDRLTPYLPRHKAKFQSTPSARRATQCHPYRRHSTPISIHALREEGDLLKAQGCKTTVKFQSTPSARRATGDGVVAVQDFLISIHALREEGDSGTQAFVRWLNISIHALREEGDVVKASQCADPPDISIHALREEGDQCGLPAPGSAVDFNPRPPRGGRRYLCWQSEIVTNDFNPRPPRGGRQLSQCLDPSAEWISIHALREEGDWLNGGYWDNEEVFQSTPSARRATRQQHLHRDDRAISIHALREEGDRTGATGCST